MTVTTVTATAGNVTLTNTGGSILDDGNNATRVTGGLATLTASGSIGNAANGAVDTAAANLVVSATGGNAAVNELDGVNVNSAAVGANVFELSTAGTTTQGPGVVTAGGFRLTGSGTATLTGANLVGTLAANRAGDLSFTNAQSLAVGTVTGDTGSTSGVSLTSGSLVLTVTGTGNALTINQPVAVTAGTATTTSPGDTTVNAAVSASGAVALKFGQDDLGRLATFNAPVSGASAAVVGGAGADTVVVNRISTATDLTVDGGGSTDQVTVNSDRTTAGRPGTPGRRPCS